MYAYGGLSRSKWCARRPAQLPGGLDGIQTHTFRELSDPGRGLMVARVPGVACLRARRLSLAHGLTGRDKLGEGHPGTPGTPAPRHPGTPAPRHPGTPARLERRRSGGLSRPFPVRVVGELAAAQNSCCRKAGGLQFSNGGAAARAAGRSRFRLWGGRRPASPPPRESAGTRRRSGSIRRAALPPAQGSLARAAGAAFLGLALMAGSAAAQDTTAPTPGTATVATARITIPFNEELSGNTPASSAFAVTFGSVSVTVTSVTVVDVTSGGVTKSQVELDLQVRPVPNENVNVAYTVPATNPLQDTSGNKAAAFSITGLNTSTGWSTVAVSTATAVAAGATLKVVFDGDMSGLTGNVYKRFSVTSDGQTRVPTALRVQGLTTWWLTGLSPPLVKGKTITFSYTTGYTSSLADVSRALAQDGKLFAAFSGKAVTNQVAEVIQSAVIVGDTLTLTYSGALGTSQVPANRDYALQVRGVGVNPTQVVVSGSTVILTVAASNAAKSGDAVAVTYTENQHDTTKRLQDADGRSVGSFGPYAVTNNTPPAPDYAEVAGDSLVVTFDGPLDATQVPAASAFAVTVGSAAAAAPSAVAVDGSNVELTLSSAAGATDAVKVSYTKPASDPLQGTNSVEADAFTDLVANNTSRLLVRNSGQTPTLGTWNDDFAQPFTTGSSAFKLTRADVWLGRSSVATADGTYTVKILEADADGLPGTELGTLTNPSSTLPQDTSARREHTASGDGIDLAADTTYFVQMDVTASAALHFVRRTTADAEDPGAAPGWSLGDSAAVRAYNSASYSANPFVNYAFQVAIHGRSTDNTAPSLSKLQVDGTALTLTYDETLDPNSTPATTAFSVRVGSATAVNPTAVEVAGTTVTLTLGTAVTKGQTVRLTYSAGTGIPIRDVAAPHYNKAAVINAQTVPNITGVNDPDVTGVAITSDPGADSTYVAGDTIRVGVTFDEAVNVDTTSGSPRLKIKLDPNFGELWAVYSGGHGTATLTFDYTAVSPNVSTQGIAVLMNTLELNSGTITAADDAAAANLNHQGLAHNSGHKVEATVPQLAFAAVNGSTLTLTFSEDLDPNSRPAGSAFTVTATASDNTTRSIPGTTATATLAGATAKVALTLAANDGETLTLAYVQPASGRLRDIAGNEVAALSGRQAANNTGQAQTSVSLVSNTGQALGTTFTTAFDLALSFTTGSVAGGYMLTSVQIDFDPTTTAPTYSVEIYDQSGTLPGSSLGTLNNPTALVDGLNLFEASGNGIELAASTTYWVVVDTAPGAGSASMRNTDSDGEDAGGATGWSLGDATQFRTNSLTTWTGSGSSAKSVKLSVHGHLRGAPTLSSTTVNGAKVRLTYDQPLDTTSTPAAGDFTVTVAGNTVSLASTNPVVVSGSAVTLTLASAVTAAQTVTVTYTPGTNPVRGLNGDNVVALPVRTVVNQTPAVVVPPPPVNPPPVTPGDTPSGTPSSGGSSRPPREPLPLQLALWTDRPAYRAGETVRLYRTIHPHDDRLLYRTFVYLERADGEERRYLAPLSATDELHPDPVDLRGMPADLARARTLEAADRELAFEGEPPGPGLWQFVMELRPGGPDDQFERLDEPLLTRRAWAKFTVAERTQLLNRSGFDREVRDDLTFSSDTLYILGHQLFVNDGATLTIEAGTVVRAFGAHTAIIVEPGGRIVAEGTREAPVVLTCSAPVGQREPGCWAGLRILGKAPVTRLEGVVPGVLPAERAVYGGTDAEGSGGVLRYVRVEFAGAAADPQVPSPAIGLYGAGSGTVLDHVQARSSLGDGFAFSGGTAACDHCVASGSGNAGLSWQRGWRGGASNLYVQQGRGGGDGLSGGHDEEGHDREPRSLPTLSNLSLVHAMPYDRLSNGAVALRLAAGSGVKAYELLATGFRGGAIDAHVRSAMLFDEGESEVSGALLWNIGSPLLRNGIRDSVDFSVRNPKLRDVRYFANPDPRPKLVMNTFTFERENYIGAFDWDKHWIEEWTVFGPESVYDLRERDAEEN